MSFSRDRQLQISPSQEIVLYPFLNFELDLFGWYAFGHHDPADFFAAVVARDPHSNFLPDEVKLAWGNVQNHSLELVHRSLPEFQPITAIERLDFSLINSFERCS